MVPVPIDAPQHMVINAVVLSARSNSCSAVQIKRAPVEPTGWPSAIAPPFTFTLLMSALNTRCQLNTTAANASLISTRSIFHVHAGFLEQQLSRVHRTIQQIVRISTSYNASDDARARLQTTAQRFFFAHPQHGGRAVRNL
jgi:hypothetical protein